MKRFIAELEDHQEMIERLVSCSEVIESVGKVLIDTLKQGGKILLCGNGGSAADCQHIAAELVVQYQKNRQALAAIALTTDSSILTAHSNDFGFETVYSRQIQAMIGSGSRVTSASQGLMVNRMTAVIVIISTSVAKLSRSSERKILMRSVSLPMRAIRSPVRLPPKYSKDRPSRCS